MTVYSIGEHTFHLMIGQPNIYQPTLETFSRKGVDGVEDRLIGARAEPFDLETIGHAATQESVYEGIMAYAALVALPAQVFVKDDLNWGNVLTGYRAKVLAVRPISVKFTPAFASTLGSYTNVWLGRVSWSLRMEPIP